MEKIGIYYNGIKVDGGELIKAGYCLHVDETITVYALKYDRLPRLGVAVKNDSDYLTDYFDNDSMLIPADHPLYKFFKLAYFKYELKSYKTALKSKYTRDAERPGLQTKIKNCEDEIKKLGDKQPGKSDIAALNDYIAKAEKAKADAIKAEQEERRRKAMELDNFMWRVIAEETKKSPAAGEPLTIKFLWSELGIPENLETSYRAAENIINRIEAKKVDIEGFQSGYYKTKIQILGLGKIISELRYDIGDNEGGIKKHIENHKKWVEKQGDVEPAYIKDVGDLINLLASNA